MLIGPQDLVAHLLPFVRKEMDVYISTCSSYLNPSSPPPPSLATNEVMYSLFSLLNCTLSEAIIKLLTAQKFIASEAVYCITSVSVWDAPYIKPDLS